MTDENVVAKPKTRLKRFFSILFTVIVSLLALYGAARLIYRYSGSNQWELVRDESGVKIYSLKQPGSDLALVKAVTRVHASMSSVVAWLTDLDTCRESGCRDERNIGPNQDGLQYAYMVFDLPRPFQPRDIAMRIRVQQLANKEVWAEFSAAPEKEPLHACCHRITNMNNYWRLTPIGNGDIEMEYVMNTDWGGWIPDPLSNFGRPKFLYVKLKDLQRYVNKPKLQHVKLAYIQEP